MRLIRSLIVGALLINCAITPEAVTAQEFPSRPITLIGPYSAGGPYDTLARFLSESLRKRNIVSIVEAKPGGNTTIAIQHTLNAPADGHTLMVATLPLVANQVLRKNPGYKIDDFVAISPIARHPIILFASAALPANNIAELIAYAEKNPGKLNIGFNSVGGQADLLADKLIKQSKMKIEKIPYKGAADLATALLTGDLHLSFFAYSAGAGFIKDGKLKTIAVASAERSPLAPEIPTFKEQGLPGVMGEAWIGLFARSNTPSAVVEKLRSVVTEAVKDPDYVAKIRNAGNDPWVIEPNEIKAFIKADFDFWEPELKTIEPQ